MECTFMLKRMGSAQRRKNAKSKYTQNYKIQNLVLESDILQKFIIVYLHHVGGVSSVSI